MTAESELKNGIDVSEAQDGGLMKYVIKEAPSSETEKPYAGDTVVVHYVGTLFDTGAQFDSSRDRGEKFTFQVGKGSVIKGWDQGIPTMRRGEVSKFVIRSDYGYGDSGSPPSIPPKATLVFEVELFDFYGEDLSEQKNKSVLRRVVKQGSGYTMPNDGAMVKVNLRGYELKSGREFDKRENVEFEVGEGYQLNIVEGVEYALIKMKKEEKSLIQLSSSRAWGLKGYETFGIAPSTDVVYEVELLSFENAKESWQLNGQEKLQQSELLKNKGTELFKESKFESAIKKYKKIVDLLQNEVYDLEEEKQTSSKLLLAANLNVAMCQLKTKEYRECIETCNKVLELESSNEKGLFRLAQAYMGVGEYDDAIKYFTQVLTVNPANKDASNQIAACKLKVKENHEREKALYGKMFAALGSSK